MDKPADTIGKFSILSEKLHLALPKALFMARDYLVVLGLQLFIYIPMLSAPHQIFYVFATNNWMPFSPIETSLDTVISAWTPVGFGGPSYHIPGLAVIYFFQLLSPDSYIAE